MFARKSNVVSLFVLVLLMMLVVGCGSQESNTNQSVSNESNSNTSNNTSNNESGSKKANDDKVYEMRFAHVGADTHHYNLGALKFKELVEERSNGRITVSVHANSEFGGERDILEGVQLGTIEMAFATSGVLSGFVPEWGIYDLAYFFEDSQQAIDVQLGPIGEQINEKMVNVGFKNLAPINLGFRHVYAHKPIRTLEDLKGLKIRVIEAPAYIEGFKSLGASPVPMAWPELYSGLQQQVVDAAENSPDLYHISKHYEVAKEYSLTSHFFVPVVMLMSEKYYQELPSDLQEIVVTAAKDAADYENEVVKQQHEVALDDLVNNQGVTITKIEDLKPFKEAAKKSWRTIASNIPNGEALLEQIADELNISLD
jgi:tripartite ATP-independent transporter DctP family solute receptor